MSKVNEKYASEALLSEEARRKLGLVIKNGSVTTAKLKDGAVTPDKLEPGLWENIDSTNRETQEGLNRLQEWMNEFAGGLEITANTDSYEAGKSASVTITAKTKTGKKGDWIIRDSKNVTVYEKSDVSQITYTQTIDKDTYYSIICKQEDQIATGQWAIIAAFPTWLGAGNSYTDIKTDAYKRVVGKKIEGRYEVTIASGQRIYLLTPKEVVISKVTMGGFEIPMNDVEEATLAISGYGNKVYKVYESSNTYQEGTYQVSVNVSDSELVEHIEAIDKKIDNYPVADGEDIVAVTKTQPTEQQVLMLADKAYHPTSFSGLGRKYLRKNIIPIEHEYRVFGGFVENVVVQAVGATITDGNNSNVVYDRIRKEFLYMDKKDLGTPAKYYNVWTSEEVLYSDYYQSSFATGYTIRTDVVFMYNGVPYKWNGENLIVDNEIQEDGLMNLLTQDMINEPNTIYHIQYDYDLNDPEHKHPITVPEGCTLEFDGGSLGNGTIIGNHTYIDSKTLCIKKDITIGGTWDNDIIYTRWFEFLSIDDGNTDNLLAFKQVQSMANGVGNVKIEFEPNMYLQSSIPQLVHSNAHRYNGTESILYFDKVDYVEINLNGSTIKLLDNDSVWTNIICVSRTNAVIKNGHLTGNADVDNYPPYVNTDGTAGYNYEWGYGVCLIGGTLIAENVNISYCKGDGINAGSWWMYPEGNLENSVVGNYTIENCEVSYTGRNGMGFKSSDYGIVRNCKIHHIGTYGTVRGWIPKAGIDIEFTDFSYVDGHTPDLDFSNLYISDCERHAIVTANIASLGTPVKSFSLRDSHIRGALSLSNLNGGDVTITNNIIEPRKDDGVHSVFTNQTISNCRFILNTFIYPGNGIFENCKFIQPEEFTTGNTSVLSTDSTVVTAPKFTDCEFDVFRVNFTDALLTGCIVHFKIDKSNNSIRTEYINTTITGTTNTTKRTRIVFEGGNGVNVTHLSHCVLKNLGNIDGASDGLRFEVPTIIENSTIEDCDFRILDYDVNIRSSSGSNIYLRTSDATKPGKCIFSESVFKDVNISGGFTGDGKTTIINSEIELANDLTAQNILLYNSVLTATDKRKRTTTSYHPTVTAHESILNIGEYVYWQIKLIKSIYKKVNGGWDNGNNGDSASRPVGSDIYVGFMYFDTTLGKPVYASAISGDTVTWVDATGAVV